MTAPRRALGPPRPRPMWPVALALALAVLLGSGGYGTWAYWQDTAEVGSGRFQAGTLDLQLDDGAAVGPGTGYTKTSISWDGLLPSERLAFPLVVRNIGAAPVSYTGTVQRGTTPAWGYDATSVTFQTFLGTPGTIGTGYPRQQTCSGAAVGNPLFVPAQPGAALTQPRPLPAGGSETLCLVVGLDQGSANSNQGATGSITLALTSTQVIG